MESKIWEFTMDNGVKFSFTNEWVVTLFRNLDFAGLAPWPTMPYKLENHFKNMQAFWPVTPSIQLKSSLGGPLTLSGEFLVTEVDDMGVTVANMDGSPITVVKAADLSVDVFEVILPWMPFFTAFEKIDEEELAKLNS